MNIGEKIIEVDSNRKRSKTELTVTKIGRRWATLSNNVQIDKVTFEINGESYGRMFFTEDGLARYTARARLRGLLNDATYRTNLFEYEDVVKLIAVLELAIGKTQ